MTNIELCSQCGTPMVEGLCPNCRDTDSSRLIHRDILLLVTIAAIAVGVFLFTRAMAAKERQLNSRVAASWYHTGEQMLHSGNVKSAIDSFRRATSNDYENREYHLALANALADAGHNEEARYALQRLREGAPENAEVNLQLARLEAKRGDMAESVRYYHNALYGLWTGTHVDQEQRKVRVELIRFLLQHQQRSAALSELLILEEDLGEEPEAQKGAGELFLEAGDPSRALKHFVRAARLDKNDPDALAGAGEAAFRLGEYGQALHYLQSAVALRDTEPARGLLSITKMIHSSDPLAPQLTRDERNKRLKTGLQQALVRLETCIAQTPEGSDTRRKLDTLHGEALAEQQRFQPKNLRQDPDVLSSSLEMINTIEESTKTACGEPQGLDEALLLIGRKHRGTQP